jgi:hypothetical protein
MATARRTCLALAFRQRSRVANATYAATAHIGDPVTLRADGTYSCSKRA